MGGVQAAGDRRENPHCSQSQKPPVLILTATALTTVTAMWFLALQRTLLFLRVSPDFSGHPACLCPLTLLHPHQGLSKIVGLIERCTAMSLLAGFYRSLPWNSRLDSLVSNPLYRERVSPSPSQLQTSSPNAYFILCMYMCTSICGCTHFYRYMCMYGRAHMCLPICTYICM